MERKRSPKSGPATIDIVYDDRCPVCRTYCTRLVAKEGGPALNLIDARRGGALMDEITARGLNIDEGMVVKIGDELHYGSDAIFELARLARGRGAVGLMNRFIFRSRRLARLLYPPCKEVRNLVLRGLGITRINNLGQRRR